MYYLVAKISQSIIICLKILRMHVIYLLHLESAFLTETELRLLNYHKNIL